jgi:hypothetical protein
MDSVYSCPFLAKPGRIRPAGTDVFGSNVIFLLRRRIGRKRRSADRLARLLVELDRAARESGREPAVRRPRIVGGLTA